MTTPNPSPQPTAESAQPERCHICNGTRDQCEDNEYCQGRWPKVPAPPAESERPSDGEYEWRRVIPLAESIIALLAAEPNHLVRIAALKGVLIVPKYEEARKR